MAYGGYPYNLIQLGREATPGTAVAATTAWRGKFATLQDDRKQMNAEEEVGILLPTERSYDTWLGVKLALPETELTYEQWPHLLEAGVKTATPSGVGPYTRVYAFPTGASVNTIKTYTIEAGNTLVTADVKEAAYCYVEEFEISGKQGEAWKMKGGWVGQRLVASTFTASIALPAVSEAIFANTKLYIDNSGATLGTTQVLGTLMGATVRVKTGIMYVPVGDGTLYYSAHKFTRPEVNVTLTMELEQSVGGVSRVATERTAWENKSFRLVRLRCPGISPRTFDVDMALKWDKVGDYENSDGNTTVQLTGHAAYSATDAAFWSATVVNSLATLP